MLKKISLFLILIVTSSLAQSNIFQPYDVFRTNSVDETAVSPDDNFVAFTLRVPRPFTDKQGTAYKELYIYDYSKKTVHPLLTGKVNIYNISFTIDSKRISFTSMLNGNNRSQIFTIPVQGGEAVQISESPNSIIFYAWHPGASRTSLIKTSGSLMTRFVWQLMKLSPLVQSAEKGAYPQLMCATEEDLDQSGFYGPTGRSNWTGPVGEHKIEPHAKDKAVAKRLWELSEKETGIKWNI